MMNLLNCDTYHSFHYGAYKMMGIDCELWLFENLLYVSGGSGVLKQTEGSLITAATFFGVDTEELRDGLVSRVMQAARGGVKGTVIK